MSCSSENKGEEMLQISREEYANLGMCGQTDLSQWDIIPDECVKQLTSEKEEGAKSESNSCVEPKTESCRTEKELSKEMEGSPDNKTATESKLTSVNKEDNLDNVLDEAEEKKAKSKNIPDKETEIESCRTGNEPSNEVELSPDDKRATETKVNSKDNSDNVLNEQMNVTSSAEMETEEKRTKTENIPDKEPKIESCRTGNEQSNKVEPNPDGKRATESTTIRVNTEDKSEDILAEQVKITPCPNPENIEETCINDKRDNHPDLFEKEVEDKAENQSKIVPCSEIDKENIETEDSNKINIAEFENTSAEVSMKKETTEDKKIDEVFTDPDPACPDDEYVNIEMEEAVSKDMEGEMSPDIIKSKKSELRLYCDLMMQQVHSVKEIATAEGGTINQEKLTEASHLLGATCDTFIQTLEDCMNLVSTMPVYEMPHQHIMDSAIPLSPAHGRIKRTSSNKSQVSRANSVEKQLSNRRSSSSSTEGIIPNPLPRQRTHSDSSHSDTPGPEHSINGPVRNRPLLKEEDAIPEQPVEIIVTKEDNSVQSSTSKQTVSSEDLDSPEDFQDAIDSKIPTFFSSLNQSFTPEDMMSPDGIIVSVFLEACHNILPLFDKLNSTAFAPVKMDFTGNIRKIRQKYSTKPEEFTTLQRMVCNEMKANQHTSSNSATVAILWLNRGLEFIREILREVNSGEMDLGKCAYGAYDRTLKPYHGWVVRGIFAVAVKALPYRDDFLTHLAVTDCDTTSPIFIHSLQEDIESYVKNLDQTIQVIHKFYKENDLNNEDPI